MTGIENLRKLSTCRRRNRYFTQIIRKKINQTKTNRVRRYEITKYNGPAQIPQPPYRPELCYLAWDPPRPRTLFGLSSSDENPSKQPPVNQTGSRWHSANPSLPLERTPGLCSTLRGTDSGSV
ncbi:hypothetical protein GWI33_015441 [Rhynchophorus ferrugineus]|uniref:Uncharacterized protein n=1 Tax=Rhynchophorus ferrugineus TaxID=354439 RepID=A0A834M9R2_RHYFE|nr:hypothetical protein GWI33_015441 [Rhynchophorus ferrugineus]